MKIETILDALLRAEQVKMEIVNRLYILNIKSAAYRTLINAHEKRYRQARAFRARIIRMVEERDEEMFYLLDMVDDD